MKRRGQFVDGVFLGVGLVVVVLQQELDAGEDEDGAEDVHDPVEARDEGDAEADEDGAHDDGADDAPEEHAVLVDLRDGERGRRG